MTLEKPRIFFSMIHTVQLTENFGASMGIAKREWMEAEERGWVEVEKTACLQCINDSDIWRQCCSAAAYGNCSYCEKDDHPIVQVRCLQETLYRIIHTYYAEPANAGTPYSDGEWIVRTFDTDEVLAQLGFYPTDDLRDDIVGTDRISYWVEATNGHWADIQEHEMLLHSWSNFTRTIKHQTRFNFQRVAEDIDPQEIHVTEMLDVIGQELRPLIRVLNSGTILYRARHLTQTDAEVMNGSMMGPPPKTLATAGRMNPAGIPYFYAAFDIRTALAEIGPPPANYLASTCTFEVKHSLNIVDFNALPAPPSMLAIDQKSERTKALFLNEFVKSITKPIEKDGREHIDYVPSQVVCEFLAQAFLSDDGSTLDGIIYPSAANPGGTNLLVFPSGHWFDSNRFKALEFLGPAG
ncbi:HEPN-associated N-terminal domain-containing protein [Xanthomonas perforans]|uniref:HEPN-associated N-terminal domain-containing protein n=1 Tax=Xanthomonas arboricola TaxID=56448 RepID=UPI00355BA23A